jgi:hypothetical protein
MTPPVIVATQLAAAGPLAGSLYMYQPIQLPYSLQSDAVKFAITFYAATWQRVSTVEMRMVKIPATLSGSDNK